MSPWALPVAAAAARIRACIALPDALRARERTFDVPRARAANAPEPMRMSPRAHPARGAAVATIVAAVSLAVLVPADARARTLDLRFERNPIRADETVRLIVEADAEAGDAQPDVEPLRRDFEVLGRSTSTQITIGNGDRSARTRWIFELAPRRPGRLTAGPLRVGAMTSPAIELEVLPAAAADVPGARDVFLETDFAPEEVYVQSQLTYTLRIYRAVEFLEATLSDFAPDGAVTHRLGKDATYTRVVGGRRYRVIERRFAVFPQASGRLALPALRLDARIAEPGAASAVGRLFGEGRRVRLASQPVEVPVKPQPADATPWLPARALTFAEEWSEDPPRLVAGEPVTWTLRLEAAGLTGEQLPPIDLPELGSLRVYPDQPSIETRAGRDAVHGARIQRIAMVPGAAGTLELPELRVKWWDVEADAPRTALIPARTLNVAAAPATAESTRPSLDAVSGMAPELGAERRFWQGLSAALAIAWLGTLGGLLHTRGRLRRGGSASSPEPGSSAPPRSLAAARRRVLDACRDTSPRAARDALLDWAAAAWPESPPRDLVALAARVRGEAFADTPLPGFAQAILALDRALWSADGGAWTGGPLAARIPHGIGSPPAQRRDTAAPGGLPSLHPG